MLAINSRQQKKEQAVEKAPFFEMFDAMLDINHTHVQQPAAQALFNVLQARNYQA